MIDRASGYMGSTPETDLAVLDRGGVAWAARLLGAVELTTYEARVMRGSKRTCADQGVPVKLSDPIALEKVAEILAQGRQTGVKRDSSKRL